jgi:hypothetical protein
MNSDNKCGCVCHKMKGVFVILIGLTFLLNSMEIISSHMTSMIWPTIIIIAGVKMSLKGMCKCCHKDKV